MAGEGSTLVKRQSASGVPACVSSETNLSSSVTLGKRLNSTAQPWNFPQLGECSRSVLSTTKRQGHMWLWSAPYQEELSLSLI